MASPQESGWHQKVAACLDNIQRSAAWDGFVSLPGSRGSVNGARLQHLSQLLSIFDEVAVDKVSATCYSERPAHREFGREREF
jgi:hypothetical protein